MVPVLKVLLFLTLHLLQDTKSFKVHLNNNGYEGVVIAINPSVPEDERLIPSLKEMVTQASTYLFEASQGRFYFRNVSILVPMTWKSKSEYLMPKRESYDKADVIVANSHLKYGDNPYTLQYGQCGDRGRYIHFTPNFLLTDNVRNYGPRGRVFVHEWAHLRWGVFDEYNEDRPFYISGKNTIEVTRCSTDIKGSKAVHERQRGSDVTRLCRWDSRTGLYEPKCKFFPDKIQTARASIMFMQNLNSVVEFCTEKTHNTEAPNLQNKICNGRSTWDVIKESADFQQAPPMRGTEAPPPPTFSLLKSRQRVICLVLDKSGSMDTEDRLIRMNQAAELYLTQIVEKESMVGLVTFDSTAQIQNYLIKITNTGDYKKITGNLPQQAVGGTSICRGLEAGFQAITSSDQSTSGSEIVLLTDGEDDLISSCFEVVKHSGAVIHTIALGPKAARELETLSDMTGGLRFYANKDVNSLMDAFSGISSASGNLSQQALQLESKAFNIGGGTWINGTVPVDSTIGNDTFFVITWTVQKPEIILRDPKRKKYTTSDFQDNKLNIRSARLQIPGTAETGTWTYSLFNKGVKPQLLTVTVTTRARSPTTQPLMATAHMSQSTAQYPSPMIVYARVSQGFLPVLGANVTAVIESENGSRVTLELWDNGAGADTVKNDGIYTRYFTDYHGNGRYSLKVRVQARKSKARLSLRQKNKSLYIPGYVENGKIILNPPRPEVPEEATEAAVEDFSRLTSGESFTVSGAPPDGGHAHVFPPSKVTDLEAEFKGDHIHLTWTAPGKVLDKGRAHRYVIRMSRHPPGLQDFNDATLVNTSGLIPKEAGSEETFKFKPASFKIENGTQLYIAILANNEAGLTSEVSNIAQAVNFIPPEHSFSTLSPDISAICLTIWGLTVILNDILN
ncbi:chloride channel accessory 5 precursor [Rattus norvegicus]|uniref:Ca(2+)-activated chloride channel n=2 Tax=Rattus norvegicus TaxID=10116 RepID=Q75ZI5_RAT|nr:chloride channel accessory 5 precursor [Rattus norvegicus]BAD01114.1 Ca(2+)-activated chloride channel [Rattus norvegicus]|eukprot:NP_001013220.1 chloride channel calcium activated 2 precursor [Rattus norvegicus]